MGCEGRIIQGWRTLAHDFSQQPQSSFCVQGLRGWMNEVVRGIRGKDGELTDETEHYNLASSLSNKRKKTEERKDRGNTRDNPV